MSSQAIPTPINLRIFLWSITSALAGFLFGFDTVVISGAEQRIQALWHLSPELHGVAMAAALYGTVIGAVAGGWPTDRFGRKRTLILIGFLYVLSALWSALADGVSPCLPCPAGSTAPEPGAAFCGLCAPNTFRAASNASNSCLPCPPGTVSLYGATSCYALGALDALSLAPGAAAFQRLRAVASGNAPASDLSESTLRAGAPVLALALLPYALLALACALPRSIARSI